MTASLRATATNLDLIVKTDRKELARRAEAIPTLPDAPPTDTDELLAWVAVAFAEVLDLPWVGPQANFFGLGGDSITAARVVAKVRQRFGAALSLRAFLSFRCFAKLPGWTRSHSPGCWRLGTHRCRRCPNPRRSTSAITIRHPRALFACSRSPGQDSVRRLPGVSYSVSKLPAALPQDTTYIDALYGSADTHRDVVELICTTSRLLTFTYDLGDGGTVAVNGADLNTVGW